MVYLVLDQKLADFFCEGAESKYYRLVGHLASVADAQLCCWSAKQPWTV